MKARVTIYPRPELLDPQGKAIGHALTGLGFNSVQSVRAGKSFEVELDAPDADAARVQLDEMARKLLANTVVEDYEIALLASEEGAA